MQHAKYSSSDTTPFRAELVARLRERDAASILEGHIKDIVEMSCEMDLRRQFEDIPHMSLLHKMKRNTGLAIHVAS